MQGGGALQVGWIFGRVSLTAFELAVPWRVCVVVIYIARRIEAVQKIAPLVAH